jgi:cobalt-precorrin 5A hydrolase
MIAVGVGCRRGTSAEAIEALVRQALGQVPAAGTRSLFSIEDKSGEPGLVEAAGRLGLALVFVTRDALRDQEPRIQTPSPRAKARFGVPSVAEAAALAGAGPHAALIVPRITRDGVTCAVAVA